MCIRTRLKAAMCGTLSRKECKGSRRGPARSLAPFGRETAHFCRSQQPVAALTFPKCDHAIMHHTMYVYCFAARICGEGVQALAINSGRRGHIDRAPLSYAALRHAPASVMVKYVARHSALIHPGREMWCVSNHGQPTGWMVFRQVTSERVALCSEEQ